MTDAPKPSPSAVTELLPCPFCGGEAAFERKGTPRFSTIVSCQECGCRLESAAEHDHARDWNRRALSQPSPAAGADYVVDETGWVIELAASSTAEPQYWIGSSAWSNDHLAAIRFARKTDAERAAMMMCYGINVRICEHAWDAAAPAQPAPTVRSAHHFSDKECPDCGATNTNVLGFSCQHEHCPVFAEEQKPCPVCANEERGQGGYLSCECPAPIAAGEEE